MNKISLFFLHAFPTLFVRVSRHLHAWHKVVLLVQTVLAGVWIALPHFRPFFKTLFHVRKLTAKRLFKSLSLAFPSSSSLNKKMDNLIKNKHSLHGVLHRQERHFKKIYREKSMKVIFEDIQKGETSSVALFCSHPHLVLQESSSSDIRKMLALSIKHNNHACVNMIKQGVWKSFDQEYQLLMLVLGDQKQTKRFLSPRNLRKVFNNIPLCYQYINVLLIGGNLVCLGKMLACSPFYHLFPKGIQQDIEQMSQGHELFTHSFFTALSYLEKAQWFDPSSHVSARSQEGLFHDGINEVYKNNEQRLNIIHLTQCLPLLNYQNYNGTLANLIHHCARPDETAKSLVHLKEALKTPPVLFSLFDLSKENADRLVGLVYEGVLSPSSFHAWSKRPFTLKRSFLSFLPHLALYYLLYEKAPLLPKHKKWLLGTSELLSPLSLMVIERKETHDNLQEALKEILEKKQHEKNQALSAQEASSPPIPRKRRM